jgi:endonuclease YncB( thermonuclease family)
MARQYPTFTVIDGGRPDRMRRRVARSVPSVRFRWLILLALLLTPVAPIPLGLDPPPEAPPGCRVVAVTDGDTIRIWCPGRGTESARLIGFDSPELFSPRCATEYRDARAAKAALSRLISGADEVAIVREGTDRYGRGLVGLYLDGEPVSRAMIDAGHARPYMGGQREGWCNGMFR